MTAPAFAFHHVALSVSDLARSIDFYEKLGFRVVHEWDAPDGTVAIRHLKLGEAFLELFRFADREGPRPPTETVFEDLKRVGVRHFALAVDDLTAAIADLEAEGLGRDLQVTHGKTGVSYVFLHDPDGNWVEILQDDRGL